MTTVDTEHRRLCHALFDAIEQGDIEAVDRCYAPDMTLWFNVTGQEIGREANLEALLKGRDLHRRRTYDDRIISTFDDGFVVQYTVNVVAHNGTTVPLSACLVAEVRDGKIAKLFEYLDSGKFGAPLMDEYEIRELCEAFFDAYENRRVDLIEKLYADDCIVWHNVFRRDTTGAENVAALPDGYKGQRRRTYNDRIINVFHDGFVIQYSLNGVQHTGHKGALWICIVGRCRDGKITRIDEYMDSGKFAGMGRTERIVRKDWQTLELCDRFFDAIEQNDYDTLESCYAPEAVIWHSHDCLYQSRADNLKMLKRGMETLPKVRFKDRRIRVFEGGFVQQHTIYVTRDNGFVGQMDVCFVGYVRDGMISRAYEYFDTGQIEKFLGPAS